MTEVTSVRQLARPRPLGLLKDNVQYYKLSPKFQNANENTHVSELVGDNTQRVMKGSLQEATLINIVAAVNGTLGGDSATVNNDRIIEPGSPTDALNNTLAVVSNIMSPRERTISIPTTQVVFEMPEDSVQKKPVYYKHSEDEEVHKKDPSLNLFSKHQAERTKTASPKPHIASEKFIKRIPFKSPCFDHNINTSNSKEDINSPKPAVSKTWSPVRRLGAWKRSSSRAVHKLSKCEAVDILDSESIRRSQSGSFSPDPTRLSTEEKLKIIPPSPVNPFPFYRAKSLPAVFPVKTTKTASSPQSTTITQKPERFKNRPLSRGNYPQSADGRKLINLSGGGGYASVGLNLDHEIVSPYKLDLAKSRDALKSPYAISGSEISPAEVRGKAFGQGSPRHGHDDYQNTQENKLKNGDISQSKENLHSAINFALNSRPKSTNSSISNRSQSRNESVSSKKGCILAKNGRSDTVAGRRTPKRVKFARRPSSTSTVSSSFLDDEPVAKINAFGGSSVFQTPRSDITYSPGPQPMSAQELLRLKQKLIPANVHVELSNPSTYNFSRHSGMKIRSMPQKNEDIFHKHPINSDPDDDDSESDLNAAVTENRLVKDENKFEKDVDDRVTSEDKLTQLISDLDDATDSNDDSDDEEMSKVETKHEISYRLVKAVDFDSYSEFEHKKMRKVLSKSLDSNRSEITKAHFVKVKLKEGE